MSSNFSFQLIGFQLWPVLVKKMQRDGYRTQSSDNEQRQTDRSTIFARDPVREKQTDTDAYHTARYC